MRLKFLEENVYFNLDGLKVSADTYSPGVNKYQLVLANINQNQPDSVRICQNRPESVVSTRIVRNQPESDRTGHQSQPE